MTVSQTDFHGALLDPARPVPEGLRDGADGPAGRRYNVYRNNVAASLTEALHESFPAISRLLGQQNMDGVCGLYLRQHPPRSPMLFEYGDDFGDFLDALPQLQDRAYLGDVARLEWLLRASYHAEDHVAANPEDIAVATANGLDAARMILAPSVRLLCARWPVYDIWRYATESGAPKPRGTAQNVLILRHGYDPEPHLICKATAAFVTRILDGATITEALDHATATEPDFDLTALISLLLGAGAIVQIMTGD